ncbi:hypothetical protein EVAR_87334_1 [Eumeta japonica]|uniref:Mos1 transposase HTH domain-containing protein n=1 Tax=Eumeta variegata TaxID=151549 RepID=A0A4C1YX53_EUMVA|nr:hypothetical protein EVAR_87334_1 [Eumeta japonica]
MRKYISGVKQIYRGEFHSQVPAWRRVWCGQRASLYVPKSEKRIVRLRFFLSQHYRLRDRSKELCTAMEMAVFRPIATERAAAVIDECRDGRPSTAVNNKKIDVVRRIIEADRHVTYHDIWASLGIAVRDDVRTAAAGGARAEPVGSRYLIVPIWKITFPCIGASSAGRRLAGAGWRCPHLLDLVNIRQRSARAGRGGAA